MTWHIPAWYWGRSSRTPYPPLNETAAAERVVGYSLAAIPIAFFAYLLLLSPEALAMRIEQMRGQSKLVLRAFEFMVLVLSLYAPLIGPTLVRSWLVPRKLRALSGKCLNCRAPAPPSGVTHCIECGSEIRDQENYRKTFQASTPKFGYASLRRGPPESGRIRRRVFCATLLLPLLCIVVVYWNYNLEANGMPRFPLRFPQILLLIMVLLAWAPLILAAIWSTSNFKRNIVLLRDRCLRCESLKSNEILQCATCGDSIVSQQLFVWKRILSLKGNSAARSHAIAACEALGIRSPMSVDAARASRDTQDVNAGMHEAATR